MSNAASAHIVEKKTARQEKFIDYGATMQVLQERLNATPHELAAWIFYGYRRPKLTAYLSANELKPPPVFKFPEPRIGNAGDFNYLRLLPHCWFVRRQIERFKPRDRYMSGEALIERWKDKPGIFEPEAFILAKIGQSLLSSMHPIYGITQGEAGAGGEFPPVASGLFALSEIQKIESKSFPQSARKPSFIAPQKFREDLESLLHEIARRAAAKSLTFDRNEMPGRKVDLRAVAVKFAPSLEVAISTFDDYLGGLCTFKRGARATDFYKSLFPEYIQDK